MTTEQLLKFAADNDNILSLIEKIIEVANIQLSPDVRHDVCDNTVAIACDAIKKQWADQEDAYYSKTPKQMYKEFNEMFGDECDPNEEGMLPLNYWNE